MTTSTHALDTAAETYLAELASRLEHVLGDMLVGVWLIGSGARDDYLPGASDLDVTAACTRRLTQTEKEAVVARCRPDALACPAKGLELVLYVPACAPAYELNLNGGPLVPFHVSFTPFEDGRHWFVVDLAAAHSASRTLAGAPLADVLPAPPDEEVRAALREVLDWQEAAELTAPNTVLNACRAWFFAEEGTWASKTEAAAWAREADPGLVDAALALRRGDGATPLAADRVRALLASARRALG